MAFHEEPGGRASGSLRWKPLLAFESGNTTRGPTFSKIVLSSPSLVSDLPGAETYLVGKLGRAYREADPDKADRGTVVRDLISGQYNNPISITAFNLAEGWLRDMSEDVARKVVDVARVGSRLPEPEPRQAGSGWSAGR